MQLLLSSAGLLQVTAASGAHAGQATPVSCSQQHLQPVRLLAEVTWYFVAMVLMVPVRSMHMDSTTTEARMAPAA
jgi:hypothetical protein